MIKESIPIVVFQSVGAVPRRISSALDLMKSNTTILDAPGECRVVQQDQLQKVLLAREQLHPNL